MPNLLSSDTHSSLNIRYPPQLLYNYPLHLQQAFIFHSPISYKIIQRLKYWKLLSRDELRDMNMFKAEDRRCTAAEASRSSHHRKRGAIVIDLMEETQLILPTRKVLQIPWQRQSQQDASRELHAPFARSMAAVSCCSGLDVERLPTPLKMTASFHWRGSRSWIWREFLPGWVNC